MKSFVFSPEMTRQHTVRCFLLRFYVNPYMVPRSVAFIDELPRLPTGKLYKRKLRDVYWSDHKTPIG